MLSICIPIYNKDVTQLVGTLRKQTREVNVPVEILLVDDASENSFQRINQDLTACPDVSYETLNKNAGRSKIRNILSEKASHPYLLFMDCDTAIVRNDYIKKYLASLQSNAVVCGGHIYADKPGDYRFLLHWLAGSQREVKPAHVRMQRPYHSFMTGNFLIHKSVFETIRFREDLKGYGHEDTLFGYELKKRGIKIIHIDNPLLHAGLESTEQFVKKCRESIQNLLLSFELTGRDPRYSQMVTILNTYLKIKKYRLCPLLKCITKHFARIMEKNLTGRHPKLWVLDMYKLSAICEADKQTDRQLQ